MLGSLWGYSGIILELVWAHFGFICWVICGICWGSFGDLFGGAPLTLIRIVGFMALALMIVRYCEPWS